MVDPTTALSTHLSETIRNYLPELLTRQQTKDMVDRVATSSPKLVEDLVPNGDIDPDHIVTAGIFVDRIVRLETVDKRIEQRTVRKRY